MSYVIYNGKKYYVREGLLDLSYNLINDIADIKGLEMLTNLQILNLANNELYEINELESLINLKTLILSKNKISEIKGLESLTNLKSLNLSRNNIKNIRGLEELTNLEVLNLWQNHISMIKGLEKLKNLRDLILSDNNITEIKGIETLSNLQRLYLTNNRISEIKGLDTLIKLQVLHLEANPIKDEEQYLIKNVAQEVVNYCRTKKHQIFEFDFAFSFAGEDRNIVEKVYDSLTKRGFKVFYDKTFEWYLAGKDLDKYFKEIYGKKSKYVVAFISKHYSEKKWTDFERQIAEKAAESREEEYIIPIKLDNSITYGIKSTIGYINYQKKRTRGVADILEKKLKDFNKRYNIRSK